MKHIFFDFDGTLADVLDTGLVILQKIAHELDINSPIDRQTITQHSTLQLIRKFHISKLRLFFLAIRARKELNKVMTDVKLFPGMREVLLSLQKTHKLYIVSSNSRKNIDLFLHKHDLVSLFTDISTSPFMFQKHRQIKSMIRKHNLNVESVIYIGDEKRDVICARKAGVDCIAVTWGFDNAEVLKHARPWKIASKPEEILRILAK